VLTLTTSDVALAAGLGPNRPDCRRTSDLGRRSQATFSSAFGRQTTARAEPEDSVPAAALRPGSHEAGQELAVRPLLQFRAVGAGVLAATGCALCAADVDWSCICPPWSRECLAICHSLAIRPPRIAG
jgi:hypothetical protein